MFKANRHEANKISKIKTVLVHRGNTRYRPQHWYQVNQKSALDQQLQSVNHNVIASRPWRDVHTISLCDAVCQ